MRNIIFISKDALNYRALPVYGNKFWKTPNIDELAQKGTVFNRHYTAAASTAMAFTSMSLGKYCYQTDRKDYKNEKAINGDTLFDKLYEQGYACHILWDDTYTSFAKSHFKCEGLHTQIHSLPHIKQTNTLHHKGQFDENLFDAKETEIALEIINNEFKNIAQSATTPIFLWLHLPHVMRGRQGYGSDIDVFDAVIGMAREIWGDEDIFISADHGHMDGAKNKYHYGFDLEDDEIKIPFIAPKIQEYQTVDFPTSTIQLFEIFSERKIEKMEYVLSETAYYAQPKRKVAVIKDDFKYIYSKEDKSECLYDLSFDPEEKHNLAYPEFFDVDRYVWYSTVQCFYYPDWEKAIKVKAELKAIKDAMWKKGSFLDELYNKILFRLKCLYTKIKMSKPNKTIKNNGK